jgi:predicted signal transduction protein with EAL and GGDEF domain
MAAEPRPDTAEIETLRERLELVAGSTHRRRRVALLVVEVHAPGGGDPKGIEPVTGLEQAAGGRIRACVRSADTLARLGGLRWAVLLERLDDGPFAVHTADDVVASLRQPFAIGGRELRVAASVGISVHPDDGERADELLRCAVAASQAARASGGDLFGFYSGPLSDAAGRRVALERALVDALDKRELSVCFQPQIDTRDGTVVGVEALLRWNSPAFGSVSPGDFVPILEASGAIEQVGAWVLRDACQEASRWARERRPMRVGVNVSARQLRSRDFAATVHDALARSGLDPHLLELELTESVLVDDQAHARRTLEALRREGIHVAVDDFGTGYASLAYVRRFPMDTLKIDRQFVRGLPIDTENAAITSAIVALARSLRLGVVAEGVETEAEEEFLHSLHCFVVQGYRHARPMGARDFDQWRRTRPWA